MTEEAEEEFFQDVTTRPEYSQGGVTLTPAEVNAVFPNFGAFVTACNSRNMEVEHADEGNYLVYARPEGR